MAVQQTEQSSEEPRPLATWLVKSIFPCWSHENVTSKLKLIVNEYSTDDARNLSEQLYFYIKQFPQEFIIDLEFFKDSCIRAPEALLIRVLGLCCARQEIRQTNYMLTNDAYSYIATPLMRKRTHDVTYICSNRLKWHMTYTRATYIYCHICRKLHKVGAENIIQFQAKHFFDVLLDKTRFIPQDSQTKKNWLIYIDKVQTWIVVTPAINLKNLSLRMLIKSRQL